MIAYLMRSLEETFRREGGRTVRGTVACLQDHSANLEVQIGKDVYLLTLARVREAEPLLPITLTLPEKWKGFAAYKRGEEDC